MSAIQGVQIYGVTVRTSRIVCYNVGVRCSGVSVKWGSTVESPLLTFHANICI